MSIKSHPRTFPPRFAWGVATAAPQIEGAAFADGKGESTWDRFCRVPGKVHNGDTLDIACDHYRRYRSDVALMARLGVKHYRLSLAWPRLLPQGRGPVNQKGVDFYHRLLDTLHAHGITPWVTLFHWDLPQALEDEGGWRRRTTADAFAGYADLAVRSFRSQVKNWITLNETNCFTRLAYGGGDKAPGANDGEAVVNQAYHHAMLAHGHGVRAVREHGGRGARVGITDNPIVSVPVTETPADIAAARDLFRFESDRVLGAICNGRYSERYLRAAGVDAPRFDPRDFQLIGQPTDFLGLNIYTGQFVRAGRRGRPEILPFPAGYPRADSPWLYLLPQAMYWGVRFAAELRGVRSIYITENGAGYDDLPPADGEVLDLHRREYVRQCLGELHRAIADGAPVDGYFLWSLMDNFEWQDGYARRFGIVYNDFATQKRTPKLSARWYAEVMKANRLL